MNTGGPSNNEGLGNFAFGNGTLFFETPDNTPTSGDIGVELWKSDGTPGGTVLVADINPSLGKSFSPSGPAAKNSSGNGGIGSSTGALSFDSKGVTEAAGQSMRLIDLRTSTSIQISNSGPSQGQAYGFALTVAPDLINHPKSSGWLNPPGTVQDLSPVAMDPLFVVLTDGGGPPAT